MSRGARARSCWRGRAAPQWGALDGADVDHVEEEGPRRVDDAPAAPPRHLRDDPVVGVPAVPPVVHHAVGHIAPQVGAPHHAAALAGGRSGCGWRWVAAAARTERGGLGGGRGGEFSGGLAEGAIP